MNTKTAKAKQSVTRYAPEDLESRDAIADEAALDTFLRRNKDAINASIEKAHEEFERGEYFTLDEVMADLKAQRAVRKRKS
jgi:predicted transcriptional regulator